MVAPLMTPALIAMLKKLLKKDKKGKKSSGPIVKKKLKKKNRWIGKKIPPVKKLTKPKYTKSNPRPSRTLTY